MSTADKHRDMVRVLVVVVFKKSARLTMLRQLDAELGETREELELLRAETTDDMARLHRHTRKLVRHLGLCCNKQALVRC